MAITQETVNSTAVVQFSSDGDDYDDLLTEKPNITSVFNLDDNLPQITRLNKALYFPNGIGAEFKNAFLVLDPGAAIAVQSLNTTLASMEDANRTGPRFVDSMICINSSDDAGPDSIGDQLPAQYYNNNGSWVSVNKVQIAPLQIANTTLVFTTSENNTNNGLVMSYSVGDGTGHARLSGMPVLYRQMTGSSSGQEPG